MGRDTNIASSENGTTWLGASLSAKRVDGPGEPACAKYPRNPRHPPADKKRKWPHYARVHHVRHLGASGGSPTKRLWIVKRPVRAHGRRRSWQLVWLGSGRRWVLGCARRGLGGEAERRREAV